MSRLENTLKKKSKKRKLRTISKIIFMLLLAVNTIVCVFVIDFNGKKMLGQDLEFKEDINKIQTYLDDIISNIQQTSSYLKEQINNNIK